MKGRKMKMVDREKGCFRWGQWLKVPVEMMEADVFWQIRRRWFWWYETCTLVRVGDNKSEELISTKNESKIHEMGKETWKEKREGGCSRAWQWGARMEELELLHPGVDCLRRSGGWTFWRIEKLTGDQESFSLWDEGHRRYSPLEEVEMW